MILFSIFERQFIIKFLLCSLFFFSFSKSYGQVLASPSRDFSFLGFGDTQFSHQSNGCINGKLYATQTVDTLFAFNTFLKTQRLHGQ